MARKLATEGFDDNGAAIGGYDNGMNKSSYQMDSDWSKYLTSLYPSAGGYEVPKFDYQYQGWNPSAFGYDSQYASRLNDAVNALQNFTYDPEKDAAYQAYKTQYTNGGKQAMTDTMAKVAARSGGIASSYANTAAAQQYNAYMQQLANKVPELQELAYNKARNNVSTLASLDQDAYTRAYNQWVQNNNWSYNAHNAAENARYNMAKLNYEAQLDAAKGDLNNRYTAYNNAFKLYSDQLDAENSMNKLNLQHANDLELTRYKAEADERAATLKAQLERQNLDAKDKNALKTELTNTAMDQISMSSPSDALEIIKGYKDSGLFDNDTAVWLAQRYATQR